MKLGKKPARKDAVTFKLKDYLTSLPTPPKYFGHEQVPFNWEMLGNDKFGDCVWAGAAHETMLWNNEAHTSVAFNDLAVLSDYSVVTGFNPQDPSTDNGTDMQVAASYRRKTGIVDAHGRRHKIAAYLSITKGDIHEHLIALYLFGAVGIGIEFPKSAMTQFNNGRAWTVVTGSPIEGGHYVPLVAKRNKLYCITWGELQPLSEGFFERYNDESVAYVSEEMLTSGKSPEGFDAIQLTKDLAQL